MNEKKFIKTSDIDLASTLYTLGFPINGIHPTGVGDKMDFYLEYSDDIRQAMDDYWKGELRVEPRILLLNKQEIYKKMRARQYAKENLEKRP